MIKFASYVMLLYRKLTMVGVTRLYIYIIDYTIDCRLQVRALIFHIGKGFFMLNSMLILGRQMYWRCFPLMLFLAGYHLILYYKSIACWGLMSHINRSFHHWQTRRDSWVSSEMDCMQITEARNIQVLKYATETKQSLM